MVYNIAVFGSCVSRDIFYSKINHNYKEYFNVVLSSQRGSIISLMQHPVEFRIEDIAILPESQVNNSRTRFIKEDLNKHFLNGLNNNIDLLIFDNYFEDRFGVLEIDNNQIITNNEWDLLETEFYNNLKIKNPLNMRTNKKDYFKLWCENVDLFFDYLDTHCPDTKIVLNEARVAYNVLKKDKTVEFNKYYKKESKLRNKNIKRLDKYIIKNYDVNCLKFDNKTLVDENHIWGIGPVHYENKVYADRLHELIQISENNNLTFLDKLKNIFH